MILLLSFAAFGADYYVSVDGDDTANDGSAESPWRTPDHAIDSISADGGHTITWVTASMRVRSPSIAALRTGWSCALKPPTARS